MVQLRKTTSGMTPNPSDNANITISLDRLDESGSLLIWGMRPGSVTLNGTQPGFCGVTEVGPARSISPRHWLP